MELLSLLNISIVLLMVPLALLSFVAIKYARSGPSRLWATIFFIVASSATFIIPLELTSYPKIVTAEWFNRQLEEAIVVWGGVHPDTKHVFVLLFWEGQNHPRYYTLQFDSKEEEMRTGEALQEAMEKSEESQEQGGSGTITMKYPFLSAEERKKKLAEEAQAQEGNNEGEFWGGTEQENDSTFIVEPPPPPNPEKN